MSMMGSDADSLDRVHRVAAVSLRSLLHLTDATIHVAAAFLFAVLVATVSPFGFSWPYKATLWYTCCV